MSKENAKPQIRFAGFTDAWEQRKLGDYCDMFNGDRSAKYPNAQDMVGEGIPFINAGDLEDGRVVLSTANKITREKYEDLGGAKLQLGDIVYCLRGTLGKNAYIDNFMEGTVASSLVAIRPKNIDGRYMFHVLNSDIEYRQRIVHDEGAAQPNLSAKSVSEFMIPIPDIEEQKKTSEFLDSLSNLIALHQRKYDKLTDVKKAMLEKMFPKNGSNIPEIRFKGFTDAWEQRKLGEVAEITMGQSPNSENYTDNPSDHILVQGNADMKNGRVLPRVWTTQVTKQAEKNDLILSVRAPVGDIGKTDYDVVLGRGVAGIKGNQFIFCTLTKMKENGYWKSLSTGSTFESITSNDIKEASVLIPNIEEQRKIGNFFSNIENLIALHQRELDKLQNIKKAMLEKMFV